MIQIMNIIDSTFQIEAHLAPPEDEVQPNRCPAHPLHPATPAPPHAGFLHTPIVTLDLAPREGSKTMRSSYRNGVTHTLTRLLLSALTFCMPVGPPVAQIHVSTFQASPRPGQSER